MNIRPIGGDLVKSSGLNLPSLGFRNEQLGTIGEKFGRPAFVGLYAG